MGWGLDWGESNSVTLVEMGSCWFGVPLSHIVCKEVNIEVGVELWASSSFVFPQQWSWCQQLGVRVVWQDPEMGSVSLLPLSKEGDMVEEPSQGDEDTIQGWKEPF